MARPKKIRLPEEDVNTITPILTSPPATAPAASSPHTEPREAVVVTMTPVAVVAIDEKTNVNAATSSLEFNTAVLSHAKTPEVQEPTPDNNLPEVVALEPIFPEADQREMDRYFCVINNCEQASRIAQAVTHQRELQLWGVHQYTNGSRNTYSRSFYFRELANARAALAHATTLCG